MTKTEQEKEYYDWSSVPVLLRPLLLVYHQVPTISLPGIPGGLNVLFVVLSTVALSLARCVFWECLLSMGWPQKSKMTTDAAASLASITHSTVLIFFLGVCLATLPPKLSNLPSSKMKDCPLWWQEAASALLELCTGYMLFDAIFLIRDTKFYLGLELSEFDVLILAHHFMTSFYMISTRVVGAGHLSAMMLMFGGELTNPFMNGMFTTRFALQLECCKSQQMLWLHTFLEHAFAVSYLLIRFAIGTFVCFYVSWDLVIGQYRPRLRRQEQQNNQDTKQEQKPNVPFYLSVIWVVIIWIMMYGSVPFAWECVEILQDGLALKYHEHYDYGESFQIQREL